MIYVIPNHLCHGNGHYYQFSYLLIYWGIWVVIDFILFTEWISNREDGCRLEWSGSRGCAPRTCLSSAAPCFPSRFDNTLGNMQIPTYPYWWISTSLVSCTHTGMMRLWFLVFLSFSVHDINISVYFLHFSHEFIN